jgi:hypothetical protein
MHRGGKGRRNQKMESHVKRQNVLESGREKDSGGIKRQKQKYSEIITSCPLHFVSQ